MNNTADNSVFLVAHNAITDDMKSLHTLCIVESDIKDRSVHIHFTLDTAQPQVPTKIHVEYFTDGDLFKKLRQKAVADFRESLESESCAKRDVDIGLLRLRGWNQLSKIQTAVSGILGRSGVEVIAFLSGEEFGVSDATYDDCWGSW